MKTPVRTVIACVTVAFPIVISTEVCPLTSGESSKSTSDGDSTVSVSVLLS